MSNIIKPDPLLIAAGLIFAVPLVISVFAFMVAKAQMMANSKCIGHMAKLTSRKAEQTWNQRNDFKP